MSFLNRLLPQRPETGAPEQRYLTSSAFVPPPQDGLVGDLVSEHRAMSHTAVFACVRILADTIASMPWYVYRRDANNLPQRIFPTPSVLQQPTPGFDLWQWKWMVVATLALRGNSYHLVTGRDTQLRPTALMPIHPDMVHVERRVNVLEWFDPIYRVMGERIPNEDIIHIRRFTLPGEPVGLTPIQVAARAIGIGLRAEEYGDRYFRDSANPSSILHTDQTLTPEEVEQNQAAWIASNGGRRLPAILSGGFDWKPISITPEESQFLATRGYSVADIGRFYGVPAFLLNDNEKSTSWGSGIESLGIGFNTYTVNGWTSCIGSAVSDFFPRGQFVRFDTSTLTKGDVKARNEAYAAGRNSGWLSVNEIRQKEEMPPVPNGDTYIQPVNYAPLGFIPQENPMPTTVVAGTEPGDGKPAAGQEPTPSGTARSNLKCEYDENGELRRDAEGNVIFTPRPEEVTE